MPTDLDLLASLREFADPRRGFRERFLVPEIGGGRTVAVLSMPQADPASIGWVISGSFAMDHVYLLPFEVALARRLAVAGFPVLRFHGQGYGDSELGAEHVSLRSHVHDTADASDVLRRAAGVDRVGLIGARFGATSAALAADQVGGAALVMLEPVVIGRHYLRSVVARSIVTNLVGRRSARGGPDPSTTASTGMVEIDGFEFRAEMLDEISSLNLVSALQSAPARSLIIQLSRTPALRKELGGLAARLEELGSESTVDVVVDENALRFGLPRYRRTVRSKVKVDVQAGLADTLISRTVSWCSGLDARAKGA